MRPLQPVAQPSGRFVKANRRRPESRSRLSLLRVLTPAALAVVVAMLWAPSVVADNVLPLGDGSQLLKSHGGDVHFVEERSHIPIFEVLGSFDRGTPEETLLPRAEVAEEFYRHYADEFDALLVFSTFEYDTGEAVAFHLAVQSDVEGLGLLLFDRSAEFGSAGRLYSYVDMASVERYELNPSRRGYEDVLTTAAHELLHRWCCFLQVPGADPGALLGREGVHWSALFDSDASVMFGSDWSANGGGSYSAVATEKFYGPLDLYAAGFLSAAEVGDLLLLESAELDPESLPEPGLTIDATERIIPMSDVVAANGPRVAVGEENLSDLRAAVILIRRPSDPVDDGLVAQLDAFRRQLARRFSIHTGGRGRLQVGPRVTSDAAPGQPGGVDGGSIRTGQASEAEGLDWLRSEQRADGSWQDAAGTAVRDTAEALASLSLLDPAFGGRDSAADWLAAASAPNADDRARSLRALGAAGRDPSQRIASLLASRNVDGGWGLGAGQGSSVLDTSLVLAALAEADPSLDPALIAAARDVLAAGGTGDGGWNPGFGGSGRVLSTTAALVALDASGGAGALAPAALTWLAAHQNADGGFGDSPSTPAATAEVLLALSRLGATSAVDLDAAITYLESRQTEAGSWDGSVYTTSLVLRALRGALHANWSFVGAPGASPAAPRDGERVELSYEIRNDGELLAPAGVVRLYEGDPGAGGVAVDEVPLPEVAPGTSIFATLTWDSLDRAGSNPLVALLDPDDTFEELSELDNRSEITVDVSPAPATADLEVSADEILVDPSSPAELPASLSFSAVVRNFGLTDAVDVRVVLWRGEAGSGDVVDETTVTVPSRSSFPVSFVDTLEIPGEQVYTVEADADGALTEPNESNNTAQVVVATVAGLDLIVTGADLALDGAALLDRDVVLRATLRNGGTIDSPSVDVRAVVFEAANPSNEVEVASAQTILGAGQSVDFAWTWRVDRVGDLVFRVEVDPLGLVPELEEGNNVGDLAFTASADTGTNLSVSHQDLFFAPNPADQGGTAQLRATVRNTGAADVTDVVVAFFDGDPDALGVELGRVTLPLVASGTGQDATFGWIDIDVSGERSVWVVVDPDDVVVETEEADNRTFESLVVLSLPDLVVGASGLRVLPAFPSAGDPLTLEADVANLGEQAAGSFVVRWTDGGSPIAEATVAGLAAGAVATVTAPWTAPEAPLTLTVTADADGTVAESSEANNAASVQVVPFGGEGVVPRHISPDGDGVQDEASFFYGDVPGSVEIRVTDAAGDVVRTDTASGGVYAWNGRSGASGNPGPVVDDGTYRIEALVAGAVTSAAEVVVDTNRTPLFDAEGTPFERIRNLTCDAPEVRYFQIGDDDTTGFSRDWRAFETPRRIFRHPLGGTQELLFDSPGHTSFDLSDDGAWLARRNFGDLYVSRADGSGSLVIADVDTYSFLPQSHDLLVIHDDRRVVVYPAAGGAGRDVTTLPIGLDIYFAPFDGYGGYQGRSVSPDGSRAVGDDAASIRLLDLETGADTVLSLSPGAWHAWVWSADSSRVGVIYEDWDLWDDDEDSKLVVKVFDRDGLPLAEHVVERPPFWQTRAAASLGVPPSSAYMYYVKWSLPVFSRDGSRLYFSAVSEDLASDYDAYFGFLYAFDVGSGDLLQVSELAPRVYWPFVYQGVADGTMLPLFHRLAPGASTDGRLLVTSEYDHLYNDDEGEFDPGNWLVDPASGSSHEQVLGGFDYFFDSSFLRGARRLIFRDDRDVLDPSSACFRPGLEAPPFGGFPPTDYALQTSHFSFESTANLTVELSVRPGAGAVGWVLDGTAADLHLDGWVLEWSDEAVPGFWHPLALGSQPVFDQQLAVWQPPTAGSFLLRLTASDLAGNARSASRRISSESTDGTPVTSAYAEPWIFSPNGDGVLDAAVVHYVVASEVHLDLRVVDASGRLVRTVSRDHGGSGSFQWSWDGRDAAGLVVPDGGYVLELLHYRLPLRVDTQAPSLSIAAVGPGRFGGEFVSFAPALDWCAEDALLSDGEVETGPVPLPSTWTLFAGLNGLDPCPVEPRTLSTAEFALRRYRLGARDEAGNEARVVAAPSPEEIVVHGVGTGPEGGSLLGGVPTGNALDMPSGAVDLRLLVGETAVRPLASVGFQARAVGGTWQESPVAGYFAASGSPTPGIVDHSFQVGWNGILPSGEGEIRLRTVDVDGVERLSNAFAYRTGAGTGTALILHGVLRPEDLDGPFGSDLLNALELGHLDPSVAYGGAEGVVMWAEQKSQLVGVSLFVDSAEDPRFAGGRLFAPDGSAGAVHVFRLGPLEACAVYDAAAGALEASSGEPVQSNVLGHREPCMELDLQVDTQDGEGCTAASSQTATVTLRPQSVDGTDFLVLDLLLDDPDDPSALVWSLNLPPSGQVQEAEIDLGPLSEGVHGLYARLVDLDGDARWSHARLVVDFQAPQAFWQRPTNGATVCPGADPTLHVSGSDIGTSLHWSVFLRAAGTVWPAEAAAAGQAAAVPGIETLQALSFSEITEPLLGGLGEGAWEARLLALDEAGNAVCSDISFALDASHGGSLAASPTLLSPNGDGFADAANLTLEVNEPSTADLAIYAAQLVDVGGVLTPLPVGAPVRVLLTGAPVTSSTQVPWDGRGAGGVPVPEGLYLAVADLTDGCNVASATALLTVDLTPPVASIDLPAPGAVLDVLAAPVVGTALDEHLSEWQLSVGSGPSPATFSLLASGGVLRDAELLTTWNTATLEGVFTLRLVVTDAAGLSTAVSRTVEIAAGEGIVGGFEADPQVFSPGSSGFSDRTSIRTLLLQAAEVDLDVRTTAGVHVRSLALADPRPSGQRIDAWDGRDDGGTLVADGDYRVRLVARAGVTTQTETLAVATDATPPVVDVTQPQGDFASPGMAVVGSVLDARLEDYRVELQSGGGSWTLLAQGTQPRTAQVLASLPGNLASLPAPLALRVVATDVAGNRTTWERSLSVDSSAPEVSLLAPAAGELVSSAGGPVPVLATVEEENGGSWRLDVAPAGSSAFVEIAAGSGLPPTSPSPLALWNTTAVADGNHVLRLTVVDGAGQSAQDSVQVTVDETPPTAEIVQPASGAAVTGPVEILGTAADLHFERYEILLAAGTPGSTGPFSRLGHLTTPVTGGLLYDWRALPTDGDYVLRLEARDLAGQSAQVDVPLRVDTRPPQVPEGLTVTLNSDATQAILDWQPVPDGDLAGYRVLRDGQPLGALVPVVPSPSYVDVLPPEGERTYQVLSVDDAGLESEPSVGVTVIVDRSPPTVRLLRPVDGARVGTQVEIVGTAYSEDDFGELRVLASANGGPQTLLRRSTLPVQNELLTQWDLSSLGLADGAPLLVRLEAEDVRGNLAFDEVSLTLDLQPPSKPTGLAAVATGAGASGSDVDLTWNTNPESDVVGYLLYRDGRSLFGDAEAPTTLALAATAWTDYGVPDGDRSWVVVAVDGAGRLSPPSDPAALSLDERAPHAVFLEPEDGARTDGPLGLLVAIEDTDVDDVRFDVRDAGGGAWTEVATDGAAPWRATWDPAGLPYGLYDVRAVARDLAGAVDPAPEMVTVSFQDLEPPARPDNVQVQVDGNQATVSWQAVVAADLLGYHVERGEDGGEGTFLRLTASPIAPTSFVDSGLADGVYQYRVVAVDDWDNESLPSLISDASRAVVYAPQLESLVSPTQAGAVDVAGLAVSPLGPVSGQTEAEVRNDGGPPTVLPSVATDGDGAFALLGVPIQDGSNEITVRVTDADGNRSRGASVVVDKGSAPAPPTGLVAVATGNRVDASWNANTEPDLLGYLVYLDGVRQGGTGTVVRSGMTAAASSAETFNPPSDALRAAGYWAPWVDADTPIAGQWWQATWAAPALVTAVDVEWWTHWARAIDYDLQLTGDGSTWTTVLEVRGNDLADVVHELPSARPAVGVRFLIHTMASEPTDTRPLRLDQIQVLTLEPQPALTWTDLFVADGIHEVAVTAVSTLGFESAPASVEVEVGDVIPPDPVVLTATPSGSTVQLSWTPSGAADLLYYLVLRDGVGIGAVAAGTETFDDVGLPNGTYAYTVRAFDFVGNFSESAPAVATVFVAPPAPPTALVVTAPAQGGVLELSWTAPGAPVPPVLGYRIYRSLTSGGPWQALADVAATAFLDEPVENGVEHFYVVHSLDALGNESAPSNEASGVPQDSLAPETSIFVPTTPSTVHVTDRTILDRLAGLSAPGALVDVFRDGALVANTVASGDAGNDAVHWVPGVNDVGAPYLSPDGRYLWLSYWASWSTSQHLYDFATDTLRFVQGPRWPLHWMPTSDSIVYAISDWPESKIYFYRLADESTTELAQAEWVEMVVPSPDGLSLALLGEQGGVDGLHVYDLAAGTWRTVLTLASWRVAPESLVWSGDGTHLAYLQSRSIYAVDVATGVRTTLTSDAQNWGRVVVPSPGGSRLAFIGDSGGEWHAFVHDLATGTSQQVTSAGLDHARVRFVSGGAAVAVVTWDGRLLRIDLATGEEQVLFEYADWWYDLDAAAGYVLVTDDGEYGRLAEPGRFEVENLALAVGDNHFTARGTDDAGNVGDESEQIVVRVEPASLPDLRVTDADVVMLPTFPIVGEPAQLTVTVRNVGGTVADATTLRWSLVGSSGSEASGTLALPALLPGETFDIREMYAPVTADRYVLGATADSAGAVPESDETNNRGEVEVVVLADAGPALFLATDRAVYPSGDEVSLAVEAVNGGPGFTGSIHVRIEDVAGFLVAELAPSESFSLAQGESQTFEMTWPTGTTFAGDYRAVATLVTAGDPRAATAEAAFAIGDEAVVALSASVAEAQLPVGSDVSLTALASYLAGNQVLSASEIRWTVTPAGDPSVVGSGVVSLADLLPGDEVSVPVTWPSAGSGAGDYEAHFAWHRRSGELLAEIVAGFGLVAPEGGLLGTLVLTPEQPFVGTPVVAAYSLANDSAFAFADLPLRLRLVTAATGVELARSETTVSLTPGQTLDGSSTFDTSGLQLQTYVVRLEAQLEGVVGPWTLLASRAFDTGDGTPPLVAPVAPAAGGFVGPADDLRFTAIDSLSGVSLADVQVDGQPFLPADQVEPLTGTWRLVPVGLTEGTHTWRMRAEDGWGNVTTTVPFSFTADFTPPEIVITGVVDGGEYTDPVTPVITITDEHLATEQILLGGQTFVSGTEVAEEGAYVLVAEATDLAGNTSRVTVRFVLGTPALPLLVAEKTVSLAVDADGSMTPTPGDTLEYAVTVRNDGEGAATLVSFTDAIPTGTAVVPGTVSTTLGTVAGEDPVIIDAGTLAPSTSFEVTFRVLVDVDLVVPTVVSNQGAVSSAEQASTPTDDPSLPGSADPTDLEIVEPPPDPEPLLVAEKTVSLAVDADASATPTPGDTLEYAVTVRNDGEGAATLVSFTDAIPAGTAVVPGTVSTTLGTVAGEDPVIIDVGTLAPLTSFEVTFRVLVDVDLVVPTVVSNQGAVSSAEQAPTPTDDPSLPGSADPTDLEIVEPPPDPEPLFTLTKSWTLALDVGGDGLAHPGDEIEYELILQNLGMGPATDVVLVDETPVGTTYVVGSLVVSGGLTVNGEDPLLLNAAEFGPGAASEVTFRVEVDEFQGRSLDIVNQAWVESAETDLMPSDDPDQPGPGDPTVVTAWPSDPVTDPMEIPMLGFLAQGLLALWLSILGAGRLRRKGLGGPS